MPAVLRREGFTIVELIIVLAIITILMTFAIQRVVNSRIASNEGSAVISLRSMTSANQQYKVRLGTYASQLSDFSDSGYIDSVLGSADVAPGKSGYLFTYSGGSTTWNISAEPTDVGYTERRYFYVDQSGIIRFSETGPVSTADPAID